MRRNLFSVCKLWLLMAAAPCLGAPPQVNYFFPAGAARESSVTITASGSFSRWPAQAWIDQPGIGLTAEADKGKWKLSVSAEASAGVYWVRCFDDEGASSPVPLIVGTLPEVNESEPNDRPGQAQRITGPTTVNGRLGKSGDVDAFAIELRAGQTLVASVQAHSILGSPMDGVVQVCWWDRQDSATGDSEGDVFVVGQTDDTVGLDPRLAIQAPRDGTYLVRVFAFPVEPNSTIGFAGADNFVYRLTMTTAGFVDHVRPTAVPAAVATEVELCGWNIPDALRTLTVTPTEGADSWTVFRPELASFASMAVVNTATYQRRDNAGGTTESIMVPATITGRLEQARQSDTYSFRAAKGRKLRMRAESRSLGYATDAELFVTDAAGENLAQNDDVSSNRDPELVFTPPADGEYRVTIRDVNGRGDFRNVYRLTVAEAVPDFALSLAADSVVLVAGKTVELPVTVDRRDGFAEVIEISADKLPAGVTAAVVKSANNDATAKSVKLVLTADAAATAHHGPLLVQGKSGTAEAQPRAATYKLKSPAISRKDLFLTVRM